MPNEMNSKPAGRSSKKPVGRAEKSNKIKAARPAASEIDPGSANDSVLQDFKDAIKRISENAPWNPKNIKLAKRGMLKGNPTTIAREAGHSRTLIGHDTCKYIQLRTEILGVKTPHVKGKTQKERNHELIVEKRDILASYKLCMSRLAACILRMEAMEKEYKKRVRQQKRGERKRGVDLKIVGRELAPKCDACGKPI